MNIFDYIENKSYEIAKNIGENESEEKIEIYEYSIFLIFSNLFTFGIGLVISLLFGYAHIYLVSLFSFIPLRVKSGGVHCDRFSKCFIVTNIAYIIICIISILLINFSNITFIIAMILGLYMIHEIPVPSENSPSRGEKIDKKFRLQYSTNLLILLIISLLCIIFNYLWISSTINISILMLVLWLSKIGYKIFDKINKIK